MKLKSTIIFVSKYNEVHFDTQLQIILEENGRVLDSPENVSFPEKSATMQQATKHRISEDTNHQIMSYVRFFCDLT